MWDIFGIKARQAAKQAEQERLEQERKKARKAFIQKRREIVSTYLDQKHAERMELARKLEDDDLQHIQKYNSVCPNCGSTRAINKFVRLKGNLDGKLQGRSSGNSYHSILGGYGSFGGSINGSVHGEMDTMEVKECRDCGNQWNIMKPRHSYTSDYVNDHYSITSEGEVEDLYRYIKEALEGTWPSKEPWFTKYFKDTPREVIEYLIFKYYFSYRGPYRWHEEKAIFGIPATKDEEHLRPEIEGYEFQFTEEVWIVVQKLLKRGQYQNFQFPKKDDLDDL